MNMANIKIIKTKFRMFSLLSVYEFRAKKIVKKKLTKVTKLTKLKNGQLFVTHHLFYPLFVIRHLFFILALPLPLRFVGGAPSRAEVGRARMPALRTWQMLRYAQHFSST
jgi:hypothetical protein